MYGVALRRAARKSTYGSMPYVWTRSVGAVRARTNPAAWRSSNGKKSGSGKRAKYSRVARCSGVRAPQVSQAARTCGESSMAAATRTPISTASERGERGEGHGQRPDRQLAERDEAGEQRGAAEREDRLRRAPRLGEHVGRRPRPDEPIHRRHVDELDPHVRADVA